MRQSDIIHNLFHLSLHLLLCQPLQTGVEPDVFFHCQPGLQQTKKSQNDQNTRGCKRAENSALGPVYVHAEKYVVLGTDAQILPDGAEFSADVLAEDVGRTRGGWKQPRQD